MWNGEENAEFFAVSLQGRAREAYADLPLEYRRALIKMFCLDGRPGLHIAELRARPHQKGKTLQELCQSVRWVGWWDWWDWYSWYTNPTTEDAIPDFPGATEKPGRSFGTSVGNRSFPSIGSCAREGVFAPYGWSGEARRPRPFRRRQDARSAISLERDNEFEASD